MTDILKAPMDERQRAKWRVEADRAAAHLKVQDFGELTKITAGFVFNDAIVKIPLEVELIRRLNEQALADVIFESALAGVDHRAAGESADARPASGMECGHAAPLESSLSERSSQELRCADTVTPAVPAVTETCWCRLPPAYTEQCANQATGGVRLFLFPHVRFQKRYGRKPMLALLLDLPVCDSCYAKLTPMQVVNSGLAPGQWGEASKQAQRQNAGVLPIQENSEIAFVAWDHPEYVQLRAHIAKHHPDARPNRGKA